MNIEDLKKLGFKEKALKGLTDDEMEELWLEYKRHQNQERSLQIVKKRRRLKR